jgi:hypothetical protein
MFKQLSLVMRWLKRPPSRIGPEEEYLNDAVDIYDLELRMRELQERAARSQGSAAPPRIGAGRGLGAAASATLPNAACPTGGVGKWPSGPGDQG